jgi:hypothetical protein
MELHESVRDSYKETVIKETEGFRLILKKHEVLSPKGLYNVDMLQETLDKNGQVEHASVYNFFLDSDDLKTLASALTA